MGEGARHSYISSDEKIWQNRADFATNFIKQKIVSSNIDRRVVSKIASPVGEGEYSFRLMKPNVPRCHLERSRVIRAMGEWCEEYKASV